MSLRGGAADEAISSFAALHFASLAMTPFYMSLRGGAADEAISSFAALHFASLAMTLFICHCEEVQPTKQSHRLPRFTSLRPQ
jgi:hypothetical protein